MSHVFSRFASLASWAVGQPLSFTLAVVIVLAWAVSGPLFGFSDTWQLVINTGTTIITFLMVFLIQSTQNRDGAAIQAKLDELIRAMDDARNEFIGIEHLAENELAEVLRATEEAVSEATHDQDSKAIEKLRASFDRLTRSK